MFLFLAFIVMFGVYLFVDFLIKKKRIKKKFSIPRNIVEQYARLEIPTSKVTVLQREYYEEEEVSGSIEVKSLDALYDGNRNVEVKRKFICALTASANLKGRDYVFKSTGIEASEMEIRMKLQTIDSITIYYKKEDPDYCYFDLSFLNN